MAEIPPFLEILPTPNPEEVAFRVRLSATGLFPSQLPRLNTPFNKCGILPIKSRVTQAELGLYEYTQMTKEGSYLWFYFVKAKKDSEMGEPFETVPACDSHPWPPMLREVKCTPDAKFPLATNVGDSTVNTPRNYVTVDYVPEAAEGTRILIKRYYGPRIHLIPQHPAPLATSVNWDIPGANDFYRKALHPAIGVRVTDSGAEIIVGEAARHLKGVEGAEFFPATNMTEWTRYVFRDGQQKDSNGGWLREQWIAIPPHKPESIQDAI